MGDIKERKVEGCELPIYYAAFSKDRDNVRNSSSGGIFYELCRAVLAQNGTVYGAVQKDVMDVIHERAKTLDDIKKFRRSKYLRSSIGRCYEKAKRDLENGKVVLFSGTPCQIAGLYSYLGGRTNNNLYTVEVVCHGVPLKEAYRKYVKEKNAIHGSEMCSINFRDKRTGWKENQICELFSDGEEENCLSTLHPHHLLYLKGINMEAACGKCKYAELARISDITMADFWQYNGVISERNQNNGISLVAINSIKGQTLFRRIIKELYVDRVREEEVLKSCRHMNHAPFLHPNQEAFQELIRLTTFQKASSICTEFGEVVSAMNLQVMQTRDINSIFRTFMRDSQEIIYVADAENKLKGIVTFGAFIKAYIKDQEWVNYEFRGICLQEDDCIKKIDRIFAENSKINRIPITDKNGRLIFEVRRTIGENGKKDIRRLMLPFVRIVEQNQKCFYYKRPDLQKKFTYSKWEHVRIEKQLSFPILCKNMDGDNEELKEILNTRFSKEYVEGLCKIPPILQKGNYYLHADSYSELVNVIGGVRRTCFQPLAYRATIHVYGRCGVFGYAVEDAETMPSRLQQLVAEYGIKVVSHSTWGADDENILGNLNEDLANGVIEAHDMILLYMNFIPCMEEISSMGIHIADTTSAFHNVLGRNNIEFYDIPGHMNAEGYGFIAHYIYNDIKSELTTIEEKDSEYRKCIEQKEILGTEQRKELQGYIDKVKEEISICNFQEKRVGAIVMNGNPFTKGHRYLIETAAREIDILLVFVVEEDKSEFPFEDRMEMARLGTQDIGNVFVVPSGSYIISMRTFPGYFIKEQAETAEIDVSKDVEVFARYIAPAFHIQERFVGTEPEDRVTNNYNQAQKSILTEYGISVQEINRLRNQEDIISAKKVRQFIHDNNMEGLEKFLPESTLNYLKKKRYI